MQRSVERLNGVKELELDIDTGRATVAFDPGKTVTPEVLWQAILDSGFTPVRVETKGKVYEGPEK